MTKNLATAIATAALTASFAGIVVADDAKEAAPNMQAKVGEAAPDFTLHDYDGNAVTLADLEGKIVVLEWTNPDCPFVMRHYADDVMTMTRIANEYAEQNVVWLAVNSTHYWDNEKNRAWAEKKDLPYPILSDVTGTVGRLYAAKTTPHMYIIDAEGTLAYAGAIDDDQRGSVETPTNYVRAALDALIAGEKVELAQTKPYGCSVKYAKANAS